MKKKKGFLALAALFCCLQVMFWAGDAEHTPTSSVENASEQGADTELDTDNKRDGKSKITDAINGGAEELSVHFIDVGQGDCTLISIGAHHMLIDAGDNYKGTAVQLYLIKQGVEKLDYVIATHPDSDHIGGLDVILTKFDCDIVFMMDSNKETKTYQEVLDVLSYRQKQYVVPTVSDTYALGDASFTIVGPLEASEDSNNNSICILLTHGQNRFLFCGDSEEEEQADILEAGLDIHADVYKVPHHGSKNGTSQAFYQAVSPSYAVISVGEGNAYGHPDGETLNTLRQGGTQLFRTDEQGSIVITSDAEQLSFNCAPTESWQAGEAKAVSDEENVSEAAVREAAVSEAETTYVLNVETKKFHRPDCGHLPTSNRKDSTADRDSLISQGYKPCGFCEP